MDEADFHLISSMASFTKPIQGLLKQVVSVGKPQYLVAVTQGISAEESDGGESLASASREHKQTSGPGGWFRLVPRPEFGECLGLVGRFCALRRVLSRFVQVVFTIPLIDYTHKTNLSEPTLSKYKLNSGF
jgi:hypothetical protein